MKIGISFIIGVHRLNQFKEIIFVKKPVSHQKLTFNIEPKFSKIPCCWSVDVILLLTWFNFDVILLAYMITFDITMLRQQHYGIMISVTDLTLKVRK